MTCMTPSDDAHGPPAAPTAGDDAREKLRTELGRVADRLRTLGLARLDRPAAGGSPADRAHATSQRLADLAAAAAGRPARLVPRLASHAAGDQVTVLAADVLAEGDGPAVAAAADELTALRRGL